MGSAPSSVLLFHADDLFHQGPIVQHGYLAVDMFFLLSGFVIAFVHQGHSSAAAGSYRSCAPAPVACCRFTGWARRSVWRSSSGLHRQALVIAYSWAAIWIVIPVTTLFHAAGLRHGGHSFSPAMTSVTWSLLVEWLVNIAYGAGLFRCRTRTLAALAIAGWLAMAVAGYFTGKGWCVGMNRYDFISYGILRGAPSFSGGRGALPPACPRMVHAASRHRARRFC